MQRASRRWAARTSPRFTAVDRSGDANRGADSDKSRPRKVDSRGRTGETVRQAKATAANDNNSNDNNVMAVFACNT